MTSRILSVCFAAMLFVPLAGSAQENFPLPVGWDEMDGAKQQEYRDIWGTFSAGRAALKLTAEEKAALDPTQKKARYDAVWELRRGLHDELAAKGFRLKPYSEMMVESNVKAAMEKAPADPESLESVVGSIIYDDGVTTISFSGGSIIGNRFDTFTGGNPILASGTISTIAAVVVPGAAVSDDSAGFVIEGPLTGGGGAFAIFSTFTNVVGSPASTTVTFPGLGVNYTGSSFFVLFGDFANSYVPAFGTGSNNGQGFHGVVGYTGGMGPNITNTFNFGGALNGLVRATGNILGDVPVELMKFEVESKEGAKKVSPVSEELPNPE